MRKVTLAGLLFVIFSTLQSHVLFAQQLTFNVAAVTADCEQQTPLAVPITVENFNMIGGVQFAVTWDTAVLGFNDVIHQFPPTVLIIEDNTDDGELRIGWGDFNPPFTGETLNNGTPIITVFFDQKGGGGSNSAVEIGGLAGYPFQVVDGTGSIFAETEITINQGSVSIFDDEDPVISDCPVDVAVEIDLSQSSTMVNWTAPTATDNCNLASFDHNAPSGNQFPIGMTPVTYTALDDAGNDATCVFNVTVTQSADAGKLHFQLEEKILDCIEDSVVVTLRVSNFDTISSFQFGVEWDTAVVKYRRHVSFLPPAATFLEADSDSTNISIRWADFSFPIGEDLPDDMTIVSFVFDKTGLASQSSGINFTALPFFPIEVTKDGVTMASTDFVLRDGSVSIADTIAPMIADCPVDMTVLVPVGAGQTAVSWIAPTASDNCNLKDFTNNFDSGDDFPVGITSVEYIAIDDANNADTCVFNIIIEENQAGGLPEFILRKDTIDCNADSTIITIAVNNFDTISSFQFGIEWDTSVVRFRRHLNFLPPAASFLEAHPDSTNLGLRWADFSLPVGEDIPDGEAIVTLVFDVDAEIGDSSFFKFVSLPQFPIEVTKNGFPLNSAGFTLEDGYVLVRDTEAPAIADCPNDIRVSVPLGGTKRPVSWLEPTASDNCMLMSLTSSFMPLDTFSLGTTEVEYIAIDDSGNSDSCIFNVIVFENPSSDEVTFTLQDAPITCDATTASIELTVANFDSIHSFVLGMKFDTADLEFVSFQGFLPAVSATDMDSIANGEFAFSWEMQDAPLYLNLPDDSVILKLDFNLKNSFEDSSAVSLTDLLHATQEVVHHRIGLLSVDDILFNSGVVRVEDITIPVLRCRTDTTVTVPVAPTIVGDLGLIGAADNCGVDTIYYQLSDPTMTSGDADASNESFEEGVTTVTYFGTDEAGNTGECSFEVTVVINDPKDIQLQCPTPSPISNELTLCDAEVSGLGLVVLNGASDLTDTTFVINASSPIAGDDDASGNRFAVGTTTVVYTVTDINGDEHTCDFVVTVEDNEMPMLTCPDDLSATIPVGDCDVPVSWTGEMVSDNCPGNISLSPDMAPGTSFSGGVHTVTYTARDMAANEITCFFEITVTGGGKPLFSGTPVDTIVKADTMMCSAFYTWTPPTATTSCGMIDSLIGSHDHLGTTFSEGVNEVTYVAYTSLGTTDTLRFTVTVEDKESPVIIGCPNDTMVFANPATCTAVVDWAPTDATDNCGIFEYFKTHQPDYQFPPSNLPTSVLLIASDSSGNSTICSFDVTVVDTVKPYFANCPEPVSVFVDGTIVSDADDFILFNDNDNCMGARLFFSPPAHTDTCGFATLRFPTDPNLMSGSSFGIGAYELVYTATDGAGNSAECKVEITVNPMPTLNATANKTAACEGEDIMLSATIPGANYTYEWTGPNGFLKQEIDPVISSITAADAGDYILTATSPVGCTVSETISISVSGKPQLEITHNDILCASGVSDLKISATELTGATIAFWSWTGLNGFTDNQQDPIVSNATPDDSGIYKVIATTIGGCVDSTELDIQISDMPVMPTLAPVGDDFELCEGETSTFLGSMLMGQTVEYFWEVSPDNGVDWTPANINALAMTFDQAGDFTVRYWGSVDGCLSDTAEVLISVKTAPSVAVGSNAPILCANGTQDLELIVNGSADSFEWSGPNSFSVTDKNPIRENVTAADAGFYTLKATNGDGCFVEQNIDIEITEGPSPQQPFVTPDNSSICLGEAHRIDGQAYSSNAGVVYRWFASPSAGSGLPLVATNRVIQAIPTIAGNYTFKYVVEVGGCATDTAEVNLMVNDLPEVVLDYNDPLTCITEGMSLILSETAGDATSWDWSGPQSFSSVNKTPVVPNITKDNAGTYTVNVEDANGCKNTGSIDVVISDGIIPLDISINNINPCEDLDSLILETQMIPGATYNWTGPVNIMTTTNQVIVPAATADFSGMYTVSATTADGCDSPVSDPMEVEVLDAPVTGNDYVLVLFETPILIDVLGNDVFNMTRPFNISVVSPPSRGTIENLKDGRFNYTPNEKELDEDYMTYEICYDECEMLCSRAIVTFDIKHDPNECVVPTVITPNNDGKNDLLRVSCVEANTFPENQIMIFNEWGDEVFEAAPYNNDWDGTYNGKPVPDGTYYYLFFRTPSSEPQKGFITVFR